MYADAETPQLQTLLKDFSDMLIDRERERQYMLERLDAMSRDPLKMYTTLCGTLKQEITHRDKAKEKEKKKEAALDKVMMSDAGNRARISQTQMELVGATNEVAHATEALIESIRRFEAQKRLDIKHSLSEIIWSEINYHAKTLEILSKHHTMLSEVSFEEDLAEIDQKVMTAPTATPISPTPSKGR
ncbi:hypothetical protein HDV05_003700 [Chytridiales sp. JEL 0842]|nr:hypothetical protein HDV05_003700 [Chytridiales sp. JEL 0842]